MATNEIGNIVVDMMDFRASDGLLVIGTHGAGTFSTNLTDTLFTKLELAPLLKSGIEVYPNPVWNDFYVRYELKKSVGVNFTLFDVQGKMVLSLSKGIQKEGKQAFMVPVSNLKKGLYYLKMESGGDLIGTKKVIVM